MDGLQAVAHVGQRPPDDDGHRVVEVRAPDLVLDRDGDLLVGSQEVGHAHAFGSRRRALAQMSRFLTFSAFCSMNSRRGSTASPMRIEKTSSASTASSTRDLEQAARLRVHRRVPELLGVHLAEALVAVDRRGPSWPTRRSRRRRPAASRASRVSSFARRRRTGRRGTPPIALAVSRMRLNSKPPTNSASIRAVRGTPLTLRVISSAQPECSSSATTSAFSTPKARTALARSSSFFFSANSALRASCRGRAAPAAGPPGCPRWPSLPTCVAVLLHLLEQRRELRARDACAPDISDESERSSPRRAEEELRHLLLVLQVGLLLALGDLVERRLRDVEEALAR